LKYDNKTCIVPTSLVSKDMFTLNTHVYNITE